MTNTITDSAFGKNDIRGIYGKDVTEEIFELTGKGYIRYLCQKSGKPAQSHWVTVSRDARHHSPSLVNALIKGVTDMGANVVDIGLVPTPLGYYSEFSGIPEEITQSHPISGALIVTASHNPSEYNGLKMTFNKASLNESEIQEVKNLTFIKKDETAIRHGVRKEYNLIKAYTEAMVKKFASIGSGIKVVVDSANATGGVVAPALYRELGCEVIELFSEPDGDFPNHHPNPSDEKTLKDLKASVLEHNADVGIAFDGDSDRIGVVTPDGKSITGDKLLLIYALDIISDLKKRGETPSIVSEVKCSQVLYDTINEAGGKAIMQKTGHGYIKSKMKEENAILAGEMSGHMFFKDRYYGFDDAIYAGLRVIEIIAKHKKENPEFKLQSLLSAFEKTFISEEVRFACPNERKTPVLEALKSRVAANPAMFGSEIKDIITLDGMRIVFDGGFALIRQSNTEPVFTLRFEAKSKEECERFKSVMLSELQKCMEEKNV